MGTTPINESTVTTASFPIKKVAYRNSTAAAQAAGGSGGGENRSATTASDNIVHRTSGSINVSSTLLNSSLLQDGTERIQTTTVSQQQQLQQQQQRQRQRELITRKEELRKVALETAQICSTGVITTFSDFSNGKTTTTLLSNNNSGNNYKGIGGILPKSTKPSSSPRKRDKQQKKKAVKKKSSSGGGGVGSSEYSYEEEKVEEEHHEDDGSRSYFSQSTNGGGGTGGGGGTAPTVAATLITTGGGDNNTTLLPSISEEEGRPRLTSKKKRRRVFSLLLKNEPNDDETTPKTSDEIYRERLVHQAQDLLSSVSGEIWTCSLCGTPFDTLENAEYHELHCVVSFIRCGLIPFHASSTTTSKISAVSTDGDTSGVVVGPSSSSNRRNRSVSLDSLDSEYEDEQTRLFYLSAKSRKSSSNPPFQQRSDIFRSTNNNVSSAQLALATSHMNVSTLTAPNSSILSRMASSFDSISIAAPPQAYSAALALSVTPSINLPRLEASSAAVDATRSLLQDVRGIAGYGGGSISNTSPLLYDPPRTGGEITLPSPDLQKYMMLTDDMAVKIAHRTWKVLEGLCRRELFNRGLERDVPTLLPGVDKKSLLLLVQAFDAQFELAYASRDRHYYAMVEQRSLERRYGKGWTHQNAYYYRNSRLTTDGEIICTNILKENLEKDDAEPQSLTSRMFSPIKERFAHAHELIKKGPPVYDTDQYTSKGGSANDQGGSKRRDLKHTKHTLYINVVVKNSVQVVNNELERMARGWWQENEKGGWEKRDFQFEWIRAVTQKKVIELAGFALANDFTPRKVAVQLSNDLYRLIGPRLAQRGVSIQTDIEYRTGPFFVIAVEFVNIDWILLMEYTAKQWARQRREQITRDQQKLHQSVKDSTTSGGDGAAEEDKKKKFDVRKILKELRRYFPSRNEVVVYLLASFYQLHFFISLPILQVLYALGLKYAVNKYILRVVSDDIFRYVEKKGMEMQLEIKNRSSQATFMLAALREMREGDKKKEKAEDGEEGKPILGPLMGPAIKEDKNDANPPPGFTLPESLEFVGLEVDLPVGFLRLRWSLLNVAQSRFVQDAFFSDVMNYDKITMGTWSSNENDIGLPKAPDGVDESTFVGATMEYSYLMPKSAFVSANMCYATWEILQYDEHSLVIKEKTLTPEVPYGSTFIAWTQYSIQNTGKNSCRMICSVEAEFPNGQPMVARQIKSGMRAGTAEKFVLLGETICRYADAMP